MRLSRLPLLLCLALPAAAGAADAAAPAGAANPACVDVEVGGYRALSYNCLSEQMAPRQPAPHENPALASEGIAARPSNQLGLYNRSAVSNRMGSNFGKSVHPQRPPAGPQYSMPVPPRSR